jgi:hypothetical protein
MGFAGIPGGKFYLFGGSSSKYGDHGCTFATSCITIFNPPAVLSCLFKPDLLSYKSESKFALSQTTDSDVSPGPFHSFFFLFTVVTVCYITFLSLLKASCPTRHWKLVLKSFQRHLLFLLTFNLPFISGDLNDFYSFDPAASTKTWTALNVKSPPSARYGMGFATAPNGNLYVYGGSSGQNGQTVREVKRFFSHCNKAVH